MKICQRDIISSSSLKLKIKENESVSRSVMSDSLQLHGLQPTRLLCPWNSVGKNTGVISHSFLQRIFPTQGSNPGLLHCRQILCHLIHQGSPPNINHVTNIFTTFYFVCQNKKTTLLFKSRAGGHSEHYTTVSCYYYDYCYNQDHPGKSVRIGHPCSGSTLAVSRHPPACLGWQRVSQVFPADLAPVGEDSRGGSSEPALSRFPSLVSLLLILRGTQ